MKALLSILALTALPLAAQNVSSDDALQLARQFYAGHNTTEGHHAPAKADPVLAYTAITPSTRSGQAPTVDFYVFNRAAPSTSSGQAPAAGFVIVNAAEDSDMPILGYADNAHFDIDDIPDNVRWWLSLYQRNGVAKAPAHAAALRRNISPLVSTKWGQNEPYNSAIPCKAGYQAFPTGCVATAMAQIMKYWNYPTRGNGYNSYERTYNGGEFSLTFEADFGNTTYDWAHMLDTYDNNSTTTAKNAAAILTYHAGVSVNMKYNGSSSSSDSRDAAGAFANNFRYDHSIMVGQRDYFSDAAWAQAIYDELAASRPVLYAGTTASGAGHAFVCDGYDAENGLFAINWGWSGNYDGYFALVGPDALKPYGTGTGGGSADDSYADNQRIIYHIFPDEGGDPVMQIGTFEGFKTALNSGGTNTFEHLDIDRSHPNADTRIYYNYSPFNYGVPTVAGHYGVMLRNVVNGAIYHNTPQYNVELASRHYLRKDMFYDFNTVLLPCNGTYEIIPAFTTDDAPDTWHAIAIPGDQSYPTITITGGEAPEPVALPITLDETTIEVGKTATIALSPYYTGDATFTSSNPSVASVDDEGIITAHHIGTASISVSAAADESFKATNASFGVSVVEHIVHPYDMKVGKTSLLAGETTAITSKGYSGTYTYTYAPSGIVSADADGTIHALAAGRATVYATTADPDYDHYATTTAFTFDVKAPIPATSGLSFTAYPTMGDDNVLTATDCIIKLPIANTSDATLTPARVYYSVSSDYGALRGYIGYKSLKPGQGGTSTIDLSDFISYYTPGKSYTASFYSDEGRTRPLNIASIEFYRAKTTTVTLDVTEGTCTTLSLPFTASVPIGLEAYEVDAYYNGTFHVAPVATLKSGHSYIIAGATGRYQFTGEVAPITNNPTWRFMTGLQYNTTVPAGVYRLSGNTANALVRTTDITSAPLWTSYLYLPSVSDNMLSLSQFTNASIISDVSVPLAPPTTSDVYTLDGRVRPEHQATGASTHQPGILIVGGRKVMQ